MLLKHLEAAKSYNHWKGQMSPFMVGGKKMKPGKFGAWTGTNS